MATRARRGRRADPGRRDATRLFALFGLASLGLHVGAMWAVPFVIPTAAAATLPETIEIDLEVGEGTAREGGALLTSTVASRVTPGGAESAQNIDADDAGRGGDGVGPSQVLLLLPREAPITQTDSTMDAVGVGETQRIDTAHERASWEDRRATPSPRDDVFLASGAGVHRERRTLARTDAAEGAERAPTASTAGGASPERVGEVQTEARAGVESRTAPGATSDSPGQGILGGSGTRASEAAAVAFGRPEVDVGPAATTTEVRDRPRDDTRSQLLATLPQQSLAETSERSGPRVGEGSGGVIGVGPTGSGGGAHEGGHALARGYGSGAFQALDTSDARYQRWLGALRRRVNDSLEFPRARMLAMDQGTSVFRLTVNRDGTIVGAPRLIRSSGFDDLDAAARVALDHALPLEPVPAELAPGRARLEVTVPIQFWNPMAR